MEIICRLCLKTVNEYQYEVIDDRNTVSNRQKINVFLPELIIDIVSDPQICVFCSKLLEKFYNFKLVCLDTEKKIRNFIEGGHYDLPVDLKMVIQENWSNIVSEAETLELKEENVEQEVQLDNLQRCTNTTPQRGYFTDRTDNEKVNKVENVNEIINQSNHLLDADKVIKSEDVIDRNENCQEVDFEEQSELYDLKHNEYEIMQVDDLKNKSVLSKHICRFCKLTFVHKLSYLKHIKVHSDNLKCDVCSKAFCKNWELKRHMKSHEKFYQCDLCSESFVDHKLLRQHRAIHTKQPVTCEICNKTFSTRSHLKTHLTNVHAANITKRKFECQACNESFDSKDALLQHFNQHSSKKDYICHICGKDFQGPHYLQRHIRHHSAVRTHQCSTCGMSFVQKYTLLAHMRTHSGEKPYKCDKCGKGFSQHGSLTTHLRSVHSTEKRYACDLCPMKFMFKVSLRLHVQKHMGHVEKRHTCEVCGKSFRLAYALKTHALRHTNGTTHTCIVCKKGFIGSGALKRHMRTHTGEKPFECHICHFKCTQKYNLRIHINSHIRNRVSSAVNSNEFAIEKQDKTYA